HGPRVLHLDAWWPEGSGRHGHPDRRFRLPHSPARGRWTGRGRSGGGRKGWPDRATRPAHSGYLTRRLVDVAQDVIVRIEDCGDEDGIFVSADEAGIVEPFPARMFGRLVAQEVIHPKTGATIAKRGDDVDHVLAKTIAEAGVKRVRLRSPLGC